MRTLYDALRRTTSVIENCFAAVAQKNELGFHRNCCMCLQSSRNIVCGYCFHFICRFENSNCSTATNLLEEAEFVKHLETPHYDYLYATGPYQWPLDMLVQDLKFHRKAYCAKALASLFHHSVLQHSPFEDEHRPEVLVPIPLSNKRHRERGYNQAQLLCNALSKLSKIPNAALLKRTKHTQAQSELDRAQRQDNIKQAFVYVSDKPYKHIALVDDVITTGATINEACLALLKVLPELRITVWCMGLTIMKPS
ncbi:ComF family protein [Glaciecola sp. MH2013]|uniref:ComF family protein n=1 Tax=Glaciecola sp. MH2013 TaxID=2785524 RepID=UPI00189EBF40|nr:ComF family protein [Glaciecola sp. MH2013]MBF7074412.1 ComF family protein [Glaciecola sp. MH2013]